MNIKDMPTNYPLKCDQVVSSRDHISLVGVSPDNYRITRISAENWFHRIGHRMAWGWKGPFELLQPSLLLNAGCFTTEVYRKKKKISLPINKKNTAINIGTVNIYKTTLLSVDEILTVFQNEIYSL